MKMHAFLLLILASIIAGCSGGGSGSGPGMAQNLPLPPMNQVRFVNATPDMGTLDFTMGTVHFSVAQRDASPAFSVATGPATVIVTNGAKTATRTITIPDAPEVYVVSTEGVAGQIDATVILGKAANASASTALVTYFNNTAGYTAEDFYVVPGVPGGGSITGIDPTAPNVQGGGHSFPAGSYSFVVTPAGKKTILYQSVPVSLAAGQQIVLVGAAASLHVVTPLPLVLGMDALQSLDDSRPSVKVLSRIDALTPFQPGIIIPGNDAPSTITIDGELIAQFASATSAGGATYHLSPGAHSLSGTGATSAPVPAQFTVIPGAAFTQRYGWTGLGPFIVGNTWLAPDVNVDYPVPADKARVRLLVENSCQFNTSVRVDGAAITYADQSPGNAGFAFDRAPGPIKVELFAPDGTTSQGVQTVSLDAGHYYVIRAVYIAFMDEACIVAHQPLFQRSFEVSED